MHIGRINEIIISSIFLGRPFPAHVSASFSPRPSELKHFERIGKPGDDHYFDEAETESCSLALIVVSTNQKSIFQSEGSSKPCKRVAFSIKSASLLRFQKGIRNGETSHENGDPSRRSQATPKSPGARGLHDDSRVSDRAHDRAREPATGTRKDC